MKQPIGFSNLRQKPGPALPVHRRLYPHRNFDEPEYAEAMRAAPGQSTSKILMDAFPAVWGGYGLNFSSTNFLLPTGSTAAIL